MLCKSFPINIGALFFQWDKKTNKKKQGFVENWYNLLMKKEGLFVGALLTSKQCISLLVNRGIEA